MWSFPLLLRQGHLGILLDSGTQGYGPELRAVGLRGDLLQELLEEPRRLLREPTQVTTRLSLEHGCQGAGAGPVHVRLTLSSQCSTMKLLSDLLLCSAATAAASSLVRLRRFGVNSSHQEDQGLLEFMFKGLDEFPGKVRGDRPEMREGVRAGVSAHQKLGGRWIQQSRLRCSSCWGKKAAVPESLTLQLWVSGVRVCPAVRKPTFGLAALITCHGGYRGRVAWGR